MKRKKYSSEFKRKASELVRRTEASCGKWPRKLVLARACSRAGFARHIRVERKPFQVWEAHGMRNLPALSVSWPE
jgi:hypothetical protein